MEKEVPQLQNPDQLMLSEAYRSLQRNSEINIYTSPGALVKTLHMMESSGFIGMEIIYLNPSADSAMIRAYKAKSGPCYETGRYVQYKGAALAALDDDNHILFAGERTKVCEKTANVYLLPPYENIIKTGDADPVLIEKLIDDPVPFNCDTWEADHLKLSSLLTNTERKKEEVDLVYPGPFRLLILDDGRIVHRGQSAKIPASLSAGLISSDRLFREESIIAGEAEFFADIYKVSGTACLLEKPLLQQGNDSSERITDWESLLKISPELKGHLKNVINGNKKYFILTGSDKNDKLGCCPSEIVTEANMLWKAGILDSFSQPVPEESCSLTIYAFRNEIKVTGGEPQFRTDTEFRLTVSEMLNSSKTTKYTKFIKWILIAFIALSLVYAILKLMDSSTEPSGSTLFEQLAPASDNQKLVILFHFRERCSLCLNMEEYTNDILNDYYSQQLNNGNLRFDLVTMDNPVNKNLVEKFGITAATLVLIQFENKKEKSSVVLKDMWEYSQDEEVFKEELKKQMDQFLSF